MPCRSLALGLALSAAPAAAQTAPAAGAPSTTPLTDPELAQMAGKFLLPNGVELALSITSDTVVNGQLILRTVLTVDRASQVQVFGRTAGTPAETYTAPAAAAAAPAGVTGVAVSLDRQSGIQTITPTFSASQSATPTVTVGAAPQTAAALGLSAVPVTAGGAPVATADGAVSLQTLRNGTQVTLVGDRLAVANLVGPAIATAVVNSANDRMIDTVTNVAIDLRNAAPYQVGSAQMRVDALALDAARGLGR